MTATSFARDFPQGPGVRGYLHEPAEPSRTGIVLTHGAGSNCNAPLLVALANSVAETGVFALRCDLAFRQQRAHGPPLPAYAPQDREAVKRAALALREHGIDRLFMGGHSYGGRQSTMLAADEPDLVEGLLLLSYPLHPPRRPAEMRTAHFPNMRTRAMFVHGTRDPFGSPQEMEDALALVAAPVRLRLIESAGHDLMAIRGAEKASLLVKEFLEFAVV